MAEYIVQDTTLTAIADAVRVKKGTTEPIALTDLATEIESIQSGGGESKLALIVGLQSEDNPYDITASDLEGVTEIKSHAFYVATGLRSIELPTTCTNIGDWAFNDCYALASVSMPNVTSIDEYAFLACRSLTSLTIPSTCTSILSGSLQCGSTANKCTFTFEGTTPPTIESDPFPVDYINKIIVPIGCGEAYKTATNWTTFADYIEEATEQTVDNTN